MKKCIFILILLILVGCSGQEKKNYVYVDPQDTQIFMKVLCEGDEDIHSIQWSGVCKETGELKDFLLMNLEELENDKALIPQMQIGFENFFESEDAFYSVYIDQQQDEILYSFRFEFDSTYDRNDENIQVLLKRFSLDKAWDGDKKIYSLEKLSQVKSPLQFYFTYEKQEMD